jgi:hypothetical protein
MAFDLLYQERRDLTGRRLRDRRIQLEDVIANSDLVFPVRRLAPDGLEAWKRVVERGYESGTTKRWLKVKVPAGPTARTAGGAESDRPADAEAGEWSRLDGEPADLDQPAGPMAVATWRRSGP